MEIGPHSRPTDVFVGLSLPVRAIRLVFRGGRLFRLALFASSVTLVSLVALLAVLGRYTGDLVRSLFFAPQTWYGEMGFQVLAVLTFLLLAVVGLNSVPLILLAPLQDPLSEATEALCGDFRPAPFTLKGFLQGTWVALGHTLARVALLLGGLALLFPLQFVPGVGNGVGTALSILWTVGWISVEYLDAPMARHLYPFGEVRAVVWEQLPLCMGFGASIYVLLWVPVLNLFFIPVAVVAGTLLFRMLRATGSLAPPPSISNDRERPAAAGRLTTRSKLP